MSCVDKWTKEEKEECPNPGPFLLMLIDPVGPSYIVLFFNGRQKQSSQWHIGTCTKHASCVGDHCGSVCSLKGHDGWWIFCCCCRRSQEDVLVLTMTQKEERVCNSNTRAKLAGALLPVVETCSVNTTNNTMLYHLVSVRQVIPYLPPSSEHQCRMDLCHPRHRCLLPFLVRPAHLFSIPQTSTWQ